MEGEHINKYELRAALTAVRWRAQSSHRLCSKFFHLVDSAVAMGVISSARSSSFDFSFVTDKINALILAAGLRMILVHVGTKDNPADEPSRKYLHRQLKYPSKP